MSAKPDTWMPLVIGDYLKDTTRLTTEQHGAYLLLIMAYWVDGPPLDDDDELAAVTKMDVKTWRKNRPKLVRFFRIEKGVWRHKRIDAELERWAEKKALYVARAAAGGRAKAAKSSASSTPQALLKGCLKGAPQPASVEVEGLTGHSTLYGQNEFIGPSEVKEAFLAKLGPDWVGSYLDPCGWQDVPERALIARNGYAAERFRRDARGLMNELGLTVTLSRMTA
jgi:uncharacterized protein YdaU (DUF1376 family)